MEIENYKSNSHKSKEKEEVPSKKVEKVVRGKATKKKKSGLSKLTDALVSENVGDVKTYVLLDVLVPAVKKAIFDIVTNGVDMVLYGEVNHSRKRSTASKVSYQRYYDDLRDRDRRPSRTRSGYSYDDIVLDNRGEAEEVLSRLDELVDQYGMASVADLYDLVGIDGEWTDNNYGWKDIRSARIEHVRDGYLIKMPKALPLK